jgi:CheY-like chemotaxis protein
MNPSATLPPATPLKPIPRPGDPPATLDMVLAEVRALRRMHEELLSALRLRPAGEEPQKPEPDDVVPLGAPAQPALRARRRKTVLLIDDDDKTRAAAQSALEAAQVPTRAVKDGGTGLEAIAAEKPDVLVLELDVEGGKLGGKDAINMIKATMEWVDLPIVLYTRLPIDSQKEARQVHGADEVVRKEQGPDVLVQRVIQIFRRG